MSERQRREIYIECSEGVLGVGSQAITHTGHWLKSLPVSHPFFCLLLLTSLYTFRECHIKIITVNPLRYAGKKFSSNVLYLDSGFLFMPKYEKYVSVCKITYFSNSYAYVL